MAVANKVVMKPQEGELVSEISKLQILVSELKVGFSSALYELSQIQHGDNDLREEVGEARRSCERKAIRMETLVESLRDELGEMRCQILQLCGSSQQRSLHQQDVKVTHSALATQRESNTGLVVNGRSLGEGSTKTTTVSCLNRGRVFLHCYLQGLRAGVCEATDDRHQVTMQLLHSEWEYVSTLHQLNDKYRAAQGSRMNLEAYQTYLKSVEQLLQHHLLFRNTLEQRLTTPDWKGLVGDIFVQLTGHNDSSFPDMYHGYTTSLATFLSMEFHQIHLTEKTISLQKEVEELHLFSLLLAPVSRIHSYLTLIQKLFQWTGTEHPDCRLLQGSEKVLRSTLSRCHITLEEDVPWVGGGGTATSSGSCPACPKAKSCRSTSQLLPGRGTQPHTEEHCGAAGKRVEPQPSDTRLPHSAPCCQGMYAACWPTATVRRKTTTRDRERTKVPNRDVYSLHSAPPGWGDSDSGQGSPSRATGGPEYGGHVPNVVPQRNGHDCDTEEDAGDTSVFDYSSVTTCSPDGTLGRGEDDSDSGDEEDTDSQVPVLLKPTSYSLQQPPRDSPRERTVCLRWQIPRQHQAGTSGVEDQGPGVVGPYGNRLVNIVKGPPPLLPASVFRPIWDEPAKQGDGAPVKEPPPQGFRPIQATERQTLPTYKKLRFQTQPGVSQAGATGGVRVWDESEGDDSEEPCSTV
ncbi:hypothetical protein DPEC_G00312290 [Dallia pectoralis]|uniref:Uncharacterized protein n=1 Tax=Dallia pectoralis TaxID=75939 RepID=A0ACC2FBC9_DALPE|nr:hypothetical protein DPEC_G00312290 [Dallia pectoralis]